MNRHSWPRRRHPQRTAAHGNALHVAFPQAQLRTHSTAQSTSERSTKRPVGDTATPSAQLRHRHASPGGCLARRRRHAPPVGGCTPRPRRGRTSPGDARRLATGSWPASGAAGWLRHAGTPCQAAAAAGIARRPPPPPKAAERLGLSPGVGGGRCFPSVVSLGSANLHRGGHYHTQAESRRGRGHASP